jgi:hypothetical protein
VTLSCGLSREPFSSTDAEGDNPAAYESQTLAFSGYSFRHVTSPGLGVEYCRSVRETGWGLVRRALRLLREFGVRSALETGGRCRANRPDSAYASKSRSLPLWLTHRSRQIVVCSTAQRRSCIPPVANRQWTSLRHDCKLVGSFPSTEAPVDCRCAAPWCPFQRTHRPPDLMHLTWGLAWGRR